jgi:hypothetical protein
MVLDNIVAENEGAELLEVDPCALGTVPVVVVMQLDSSRALLEYTVVGTGRS